MLNTPAPDLQGSLRELQVQLGPNMEPLASWLSGTSSISSATEDHTTQGWWAEKVADVQSQRLETAGSARDRSRRVCQQGPVATGWLQALPNKALRTEIPDAEFRLLLRWWLGLPILPVGVTLPGCPLCRGSIDPFGDHFVCCEQNGSTQRHNAFRDAFHAMCARYGVTVEKEAESVSLAGDRRTFCSSTGHEGSTWQLTLSAATQWGWHSIHWWPTMPKGIAT